MGWTLQRSIVAILPFVLATSCGSESGAPSGSAAAPAGSGSASAAPAPSSAASSAASLDEAEDDVKPVYPPTNDPPLPAAQKYCELVHEASERKRRECCPDTKFFPFLPTGECIRTLSYALRSQAVALEEKELAACEAAITAEAKACDWGGELPAACVGIVRGTLDTRGSCRSSLECKPGLFCAGLGTTKPGRCNPALETGARCGGVVDSLAAFVKQDVDAEHAVCKGLCHRGKCVDPVAEGGACTLALPCGPKTRCDEGKCVGGDLPKDGQKCRDGACDAGHRCVGGTCKREGRLGDACAADETCRSGSCEGGKCAVKCGIFKTAPSASAGAPVPSTSAR